MNTHVIKSTRCLLAAALAFALAACGGGDDETVGHAEDREQTQSATQHPHPHPHSESEFAKDPGPNGGRLITEIDPSAEFLLLSGRRAQITFVNESGEPIPAENQSVSMITGDRMNPVEISFSKEGDVLVSDEAVPEIEGQPLVLTLKASPDAQAVTERFNLKTYTCSGCQLAEYACICGH